MFGSVSITVRMKRSCSRSRRSASSRSRTSCTNSAVRLRTFCSREPCASSRACSASFCVVMSTANTITPTILPWASRSGSRSVRSQSVRPSAPPTISSHPSLGVPVRMISRSSSYKCTACSGSSSNSDRPSMSAAGSPSKAAPKRLMRSARLQVSLYITRAGIASNIT